MSFPGFPGPPIPPGPPGPPPSPTTHNLLSFTHADTIPASPTLGSIIVAVSGGWSRLLPGTELDHLVIMGGVPEWTVFTGSGLGNVSAASGVTNNSVARFDQSTGTVIQDSLVIIDDAGNISIGNNTFISGDLTVLGKTILTDLCVLGLTNFAGDVLASGDVTILGDLFANNITATGNVVINNLTVNNIINSGTTINSVVVSTGVAFTIGNQYFNSIGSGTTTVFMPLAPVSGLTYIVKDADGTAGGAPITVNGNGNTIDGSVTQLIGTNYGSMTLIFGDTEWNIV